MGATLSAVLLYPEPVAANASARDTDAAPSLVRVLLVALRAVDNRAFALSLFELGLSKEFILVKLNQLLYASSEVQNLEIRLAACGNL
ncbi:hypothetical protein D3C71_1876800 [compost metagenome]